MCTAKYRPVLSSERMTPNELADWLSVQIQLQLQAKEKAINLQCGGGSHYCSNSSEICKRRRQFNPVLGGIARSRFSGTDLWGRGVSNPIEQNMVVTPWESDPEMTGLARTNSDCKHETNIFVREFTAEFRYWKREVGQTRVLTAEGSEKNMRLVWDGRQTAWAWTPRRGTSAVGSRYQAAGWGH
jgi:hypothetical protein